MSKCWVIYKFFKCSNIPSVLIIIMVVNPMKLQPTPTVFNNKNYYCNKVAATWILVFLNAEINFGLLSQFII